MKKRTSFQYNPYYIFPFIIWAILGALLFLLDSNKHIFRIVNGHHNHYMDVIMHEATTLGEGYFIVVVLLVLTGAFASRRWWFFWTATACNGIPALVNAALKKTFAMPRPLYFFKEAPWIHIEPGWSILLAGDTSFPSGHSAGSSSLFCFISLLLPERHRKWGLLLFSLAMLTAYTRMYLAAHFYADVYGGSMVGTIATLIIFNIINRIWPYKTSATFDESL